MRALSGRARTPGASAQPLSAIAELSRMLAEPNLPELQLFEKLTGKEQLWWRCCREAAQSQPHWLADADHDKALQVIGDTEPDDSDGVVLGAAEAADLICQALAGPAAVDRSVATLGEVVARAARYWDGSLAVLVAGEAGFTPETGAVSAIPRLRDRVRQVLACPGSTGTDAGQAMAAICTLLLAAERPDSGRVARVPVVLMRPGRGAAVPKGVTGTLELRELTPGPAGLFPDPRGMRNLRADRAFADGLRLAWQFAVGADRSRRCVLWRLSLDRAVPDHAIDGGSLGAAFAVALRELLRMPRGSRPGLMAVPRAFFIGLRPRCAITGALTSQRPLAYTTSEGPWLDEVGHIEDKLDAAKGKGLRLVAPAANRAVAQPRTTAPVVWAETIHQADRYARRVRPVRTVVAVTVLLAAVGSGAGASQVIQARQAASHQRNVAIAGMLADISENQGTHDPRIARLLSVAAWRIAPSATARYAMLTAAALPGTGFLTRDRGRIFALAFSPGGKTLASAGESGAVKLWDMAAGRAVRTFGKTADEFGSVTFSPDGRVLAASDLDGTIWLWDVATGEVLNTHTGTADSIVFSPHGETIASTSTGDNSIQLWNVATGAVTTLTGHTDTVRSLSFRPHGNELASAGDDGTIKLWDARTGMVVRTFPRQAAGVGAVAFGPHGTVLASGAEDGTVQLWNYETGALVRTLTGHTDWVRTIAFSPDGKTFASAGDDATIRVWRAGTGELISTFPGHTASINAVAYQPDGNALASAGDDGTIRLWDVTAGRPARTLTGHRDYVDAVAYSPDGKLLASGSQDDTVRLWDTATGRHTKTLYGHGSFVTGVAFSPDGKIIASSSQDDTVRLWSTATGHLIRVIIGGQHLVNGIAFSPDGKVVASAGEDGTVRLWSTATGRLLRLIPGRGAAASVRSVAFSPDGKTLASIANDDVIRFWDAATGQPVRTITGAKGPGISVTYSPGGKIIASTDADASIRMLDAATGSTVAILTGHYGPVWSVAFSPDGKTLASASTDRTVRLWDTATGRQIGTPLTGHTDFVLSVAFSPDGTTLASGGADKTVRLWNVAYTVDPPAYLCKSVRQSLTRAEWMHWAPVGSVYQNICP